MAAVIRKSSKWCYLCDNVLAKHDYKKHLEDHGDDWGNVTFSNTLTDVCKTKCKICGRAFSLSAMRGHTKSFHKITITEYKEKFNQPNYDILVKIFHKCGICGKPVLFDSDTIAVHLKNGDNHSIRELLKKKMQLNYGLLPKGGGEDPSQSKSFGTLFVHQQFWNFGQKREGVDQIQKFLGTFYPDFGEIRHKKCPKSSTKKISLRKSVPKVPKVWGVGGGLFQTVAGPGGFICLMS